VYAEGRFTSTITLSLSPGTAEGLQLPPVFQAALEFPVQ
jgi:hypothetical protein